MEGSSDNSIKYLVDEEETSLLAPPTTIATPSRNRGSNINHYKGQTDTDDFDDVPNRKHFNWHVIPIIAGASMMAIMGGTTNAFNIFSDKVQDDLNLTDSDISLLSGFALLGLYFTLPVGYLLDRFGPFKVGFVSVFFTGLCYLAAAYCSKELYPLYFLLMVAIGFGSGGFFMSALGTSLSISPTGGGFGVACVSAAMSLSVAFISVTTDEYSKSTGCKQDHCWRNYFRMFSIFFACISLPGSLLLWFFRKEEYPHLMKRTSKAQSKTLKESLFVLQDPFFWSLFAGYFFGIGSCVFILTQASALWDDYNQDSHLDSWGNSILMVFSFCNAASNILCGVASDWLANNGILSHSTFVALVQFMFAAVFGAIGILDTIPHAGNGSLVVAFLMASVGLSFGAYLVVFPTATAETWGANNFGKIFAFLSMSSTAASLAIPNIATAISNSFGHFTAMYFGMSGALFLSSILMIVIPRLARTRRGTPGVPYSAIQ